MPHATILHFEHTNEDKEKEESPMSQDESRRIVNRVVVCHSNDCKDVTTSSLILLFDKSQGQSRKESNDICIAG